MRGPQVLYLIGAALAASGEVMHVEWPFKRLPADRAGSVLVALEDGLA